MAKNQILKPVLVSALLIVLVALFHGRLLPVGSLHHGDEFLTLDRSQSFVIREDWFTVYSGNLPTFKKPPLQYWMSAWFLEHGFDTELAVRLPSFLFALALLVNVGVLAWLILPTNGWAIPSAILLLASSTRFWESAISALLDMGAVLFATAAMTAAFLAARNPKWWYAVAIACGLGAWQKAPIPIVFAGAAIFGILIAETRRDPKALGSVFNGHFFIALAITLVLVIAWPALQWTRYGAASLQEAYLDQMIERFSPFGQTWDKKFGLDSLLFAGEPFLRAPGVLALFWIPWRLRRLEFVGMPIMILTYSVVVIFSTGTVSPRYSLLFLPMMMAALAAMVLEVAANRKVQIAILSVLCLVGQGPFKTAGKLGLPDDGIQKYLPFLETIAGRMRQDESFVVCSGRQKEGRLPGGAVSFYASSGRPLHGIRDVNDFLELRSSGAVSPPYRGLCGEERFAELQRILPGATVVDRFEGFVHWQSEKVR